MTPRTYPGMLDNSTEYFTKDSSVFKLKNGRIRKFEEVDAHPELETILAEDEQLKNTLSKMCGGKRQKMLKKLAECRFGALDFEADFNNGKAKHDYRDCPLRGKCIGENIVCKPLEINGEEISPQELNILRNCVSNTKNWVIALTLNIPLGTFNVMKTAIYKRIGVQTKQQSAITLFEKGLL